MNLLFLLQLILEPNASNEKKRGAEGGGGVPTCPDDGDEKAGPQEPGDWYRQYRSSQEGYKQRGRHVQQLQPHCRALSAISFSPSVAPSGDQREPSHLPTSITPQVTQGAPHGREGPHSPTPFPLLQGAQIFLPASAFASSFLH